MHVKSLKASYEFIKASAVFVHTGVHTGCKCVERPKRQSIARLMTQAHRWYHVIRRLPLLSTELQLQKEKILI